MRKVKKNVIGYYVYGYLKEFHDEDSPLDFPVFQYGSKSIYKITEFVSSVNFEHINLQVIRECSDGSFSTLDVIQLKEIADEIF